MPSAYAHLRFGRESMSDLPPKYRGLAKALDQLYLVGLQGPDPLFFHNPLMSDPVERLGLQCHAMTGKEFFEAAVARHEKAPSDGMLAYLFGVLCHYCLDKHCHPLIDTMTQSGDLDHIELETEFDRFLLQKDGLLPLRRQPISGALALTRGGRATAASLYPDLRPAAFGWGLRNMSNIYRVAASRNRKFAKALLALGGRRGRAFLMTTGPNPKYAHLDQPLLECYDQARAAFPAMALALANRIENKQPLEEGFEANFD